MPPLLPYSGGSPFTYSIGNGGGTYDLSNYVSDGTSDIIEFNFDSVFSQTTIITGSDGNYGIDVPPTTVSVDGSTVDGEGLIIDLSTIPFPYTYVNNGLTENGYPLYDISFTIPGYYTYLDKGPVYYNNFASYDYYEKAGPYTDPGGNIYYNYNFVETRTISVVTQDPNYYPVPSRGSPYVENTSYFSTGSFYEPTNYMQQSILGDDALVFNLTNVQFVGGNFVVCFTRGARLLCADGERRAVEDLAAGDEVMTRFGGAQPIRWIGCSRITRETLRQFPDQRPIHFAENAIGEHGAFSVSPQHQILLEDWQAELLFGAEDGAVFVPAKHLVNDSTITVEQPTGAVEYFHVLLEHHDALDCEGQWSESFHPASYNLEHMNPIMRDQIVTIMPELDAQPDGYDSVAPKLSSHEVRVLLPEGV